MNNANEDNKPYIFAGNSHPELAAAIAAHLGAAVRQATVKRFANGEISITINDHVRGKHVFIVQTFCAPVNDMIIELLALVDALKRASAGSVTAVIPYYAYNRQDSMPRTRTPIAAKLLANLIAAAGVDRIMTMDFHSGQFEGFFDLPVEHILSEKITADYIMKNFTRTNSADLVIVSPDMSGVARARHAAKRLNCPLAILDRRRPRPDVAVVMDIVGNVRNKTAILIDDLIDTAGSVMEGAKALKEAGALEIYACCTHAVLSGNAVEQINNSEITQLIITDTIPLPPEKHSPKIKTIPIANLFGDAIARVLDEESLTRLFS